ncbi:MAG: hypothetical protein LUD19_06260 [Clostridia bacterium]|nr:hypothetical protein [Clostridia bacterium]
MASTSNFPTLPSTTTTPTITTPTITTPNTSSWANAGYKSQTDSIVAKSQGFTSSTDYYAAQEGGFSDYDTYKTATGLGYSTYSDYQAGSGGGFENYSEYSAAKALGYVTHADYQNYIASQANTSYAANTAFSTGTQTVDKVDDTGATETPLTSTGTATTVSDGSSSWDGSGTILGAAGGTSGTGEIVDNTTSEIINSGIEGVSDATGSGVTYDSAFSSAVQNANGVGSGTTDEGVITTPTTGQEETGSGDNDTFEDNTTGEGTITNAYADTTVDTSYGSNLVAENEDVNNALGEVEEGSGLVTTPTSATVEGEGNGGTGEVEGGEVVEGEEGGSEVVEGGEVVEGEGTGEEVVEQEEWEQLGYPDYNTYQTATQAGFPDYETYKTATELGYSDYATYQASGDTGYTYEQYINEQTATNAGYPDYETYTAAQEGGYPDYDTYQAATDLGYSDYAAYQAGTEAGYENAEDYSAATSGNFPDAETYYAAMAVGCTTYTDYQSYLTRQDTIATYEQYLQSIKDSSYETAEANKDRQIADAYTSYAQNLSSYGANAETLASMGLTGSGYSDYLNSQAYAQQRSDVQSANSTYAAAIQAADDSYSANMLDHLETLQEKYEYLMECASSGVFSSSALQSIAAQYGLSDTQTSSLVNAANTYEAQKAADDEESQKMTYANFLSAIKSDVTAFDEDLIKVYAEAYGLTEEQLETALSTYSTAHESYAANALVTCLNNISASTSNYEIEAAARAAGLSDDDIAVMKLQRDYLKNNDSATNYQALLNTMTSGISDTYIEYAGSAYGLSNEQIQALKDVRDSYKEAEEKAAALEDEESLKNTYLYVLSCIDADTNDAFIEAYGEASGFTEEQIAKLKEVRDAYIEDSEESKQLIHNQNYAAIYEKITSSTSDSGIEVYAACYSDITEEDIAKLKEHRDDLKVLEDSGVQTDYYKSIVLDYGEGVLESQYSPTALDTLLAAGEISQETWDAAIAQYTSSLYKEIETAYNTGDSKSLEELLDNLDKYYNDGNNNYGITTEDWKGVYTKVAEDSVNDLINTALSENSNSLNTISALIDTIKGYISDGKVSSSKAMELLESLFMSDAVLNLACTHYGGSAYGTTLQEQAKALYNAGLISKEVYDIYSSATATVKYYSSSSSSSSNKSFGSADGDDGTLMVG